jgi:hypothetical protein
VPDLFEIFDVEPDDAPIEAVSTERVLEPEVMPDDFKLPALVQFVPNIEFKRAIVRAADAANAVVVTGNEGLALADTATAELRRAIAAVKAHFEDPKSRANKVHKWISGKESEWIGIATEALDDIARRQIRENARLDAIAREQDRANQAAADEDARMANARAAERAEKDGQPEKVVEQLREQARTATAAPVARSESAPVAPKSSTIKKEFKARFIGTADDGEPNPSIKELNDAQRLSVIKLCKAIYEGKVPMSCIKEIDWGYLNKRADSENTTLAIPGIEAFEVSSLRAKPQRGKR